LRLANVDARNGKRECLLNCCGEYTVDHRVMSSK
jgi:hypothetical protein